MQAQKPKHMNPKSDEEKAQKKSVSMPPSDWAFVYAYAGDTGNASKVIQKAVRLLKQAGSSLSR